MCKISVHHRRGHMVKAHFRNKKWIPAHYRSGSVVNLHCVLR